MFRAFNRFTVSLAAAYFTFYPGYGDKISGLPAISGAQIEALTDKGPIVEIILGCPGGSAIISYAKGDQLYCTPRLVCGKSLKAAIARTCR